MQSLDTMMIRHLLLPPKRRGTFGVFAYLAAAIAACELRTMGMGLQRSDGRNAGLAEALIVQLAQLVL
jgi:hypothetical protein